MFDHLPKGRWWDVGLQLVEGCTKVSPGCDNCWSLTAANMRRLNPNPKIAKRYERTVTDITASGVKLWNEWTGQVNPQWQDLEKIGRARKPQVYTFWNDLFHEGVPEEFIDQVLLRIQQRPQHFYIICTKRPERVLKVFLDGKVSPEAAKVWNLMIMTTAENQEMADLRLPLLLQIPGVLHGVSVEPMIEGIDVWQYLGGNRNPIGPAYCGKGIDWVIAGPETGPRRRPSDIGWFNSLMNQCKAAGVPYFQKALEINSKISKNMNEWPSYIRVREVPSP